MCTLALWWRVIADAPVLVAANRDEDPRRPWQAPARWPDRDLFAGRDERAGGTWLGVNRHGVVCGVTNRWMPNPNDPLLPSRGQVVCDALVASSAAAAVAALAAHPPRSNPFGLLIADAHDAFRVDGGDALTVTPLAPGVTILANWFAAERLPRSERALALAAAVPTSSVAAARPALAQLLADHDGAAIRGRPICGHGDDYATVCATLLSVGDTVTWRDTRGNPCTAPWIERAVVW